MKSSQFPVVVTCLVLGLLGCSPDDRPSAETNNVSVADTADTVYTNGKIYAFNEALPWADAVAINNGKFPVVGSIADVESPAWDWHTSILLASTHDDADEGSRNGASSSRAGIYGGRSASAVLKDRGNREK